MTGIRPRHREESSSGRQVCRRRSGLATPSVVWAASLPLRPISRHLHRGVAEVGETSAAQIRARHGGHFYSSYFHNSISSLYLVLGFNQLESDRDGPVADSSYNALLRPVCLREGHKRYRLLEAGGTSLSTDVTNHSSTPTSAASFFATLLASDLQICLEPLLSWLLLAPPPPFPTARSDIQIRPYSTHRVPCF